MILLATCNHCKMRNSPPNLHCNSFIDSDVSIVQPVRRPRCSRLGTRLEAGTGDAPVAKRLKATRRFDRWYGKLLSHLLQLLSQASTYYILRSGASWNGSRRKDGSHGRCVYVYSISIVRGAEYMHSVFMHEIRRKGGSHHHVEIA